MESMEHGRSVPLERVAGSRERKPGGRAFLQGAQVFPVLDPYVL